MRFSRQPCLPILLILVFLVSVNAKDSSPDPLTLLNNVSDRYVRATSYHIEAIKEQTMTNGLQRNWQKLILTAIVGPNGRYRYEARSGHGSAVLVSDGRTNWDYHVDEHLYTQVAAPTADTGKKRAFSEEEMHIPEAKYLINEIRTLASRLKSAKRLPDEKIRLNGRKVDCYVVSFTNGDFKSNKSELRTEETVWITKSGNTVVKTYAKRDSYMMLAGSNAHIPTVNEETVTYPATEFDSIEPENSFTFTAPPATKLVESFPEVRPHRTSDNPVLDLIGKPAPDVRLRSPDGKATTLIAFRGKPIFIEFWATWCAPCVELLPELKKLHEETAPKGLVWISVDNDEDPAPPTSFLAQEHVSWPNFHDGDESLGKAFGRQGFPLPS